MTAQTQELPADAPLGALEPVAHVDDAMPTGVTVSHQGRLVTCYPCHTAAFWGES